MSTLYIVGTPIGNLGDITYRAVEALKGADVIACEDTRRSLILLNKYGIKKPLFSCHKFNEREAAGKITARLLNGESVALITDAGMPCISDPGAHIVAAASALNGNGADIKIEVVGGVTAFTHAYIKSAPLFNQITNSDTAFCFCGFPPKNKKDKDVFIARFADLRAPLIFYSAPHDLKDDLKFLHSKLGPRRASICRELTKIHEETESFTLGGEYAKEPRGEYVIVVEGAPQRENPLLSLTIKDHVQHYIDDGLSKNEAVKQAAQDRGVPKNTVYQEVIN